MNKPILAIDFDGTCCDDCWPSVGTIKPGLAEALMQLKDIFQIVIYSCRTNLSLLGRDRYTSDMVDFLKLNNVYYDKIDDGRQGKIFADIYIDNKAVSFRDNWPQLCAAIMNVVKKTPEQM